jgi:hypothetical protein
MEGMLAITYTGPQEEISVHVAGGFKVVLSRGVPKLIPAQYAPMFQGAEFVHDTSAPQPSLTSSDEDELLQE